MNKLLIPNTCQIPNVLLEEVIPRLPAGAVRVLLAIIRFTYGFGKSSDKISYGQLAKATRISRRQVIDAVKALGEIVNVTQGAKGRGSNEYSLNLDIETGKLLGGALDFTSDENRTSAVSRQEVVMKTAPFQTHNPKPNKNGAKAPDSSSPISKRKKSTRHGAGIPPELQAAVSRIVAKMNELAGTAYGSDSKIVIKGLVPRLRAGATEEDCTLVAVDRWREWGSKADMRQYFNPETLFRESNFEKYLNAARMSNGNSHAKPEVKDMGDGFVEVDGRRMDRQMYERRYAN